MMCPWKCTKESQEYLNLTLKMSSRTHIRMADSPHQLAANCLGRPNMTSSLAPSANKRNGNCFCFPPLEITFIYRRMGCDFKAIFSPSRCNVWRRYTIKVGSLVEFLRSLQRKSLPSGTNKSDKFLQTVNQRSYTSASQPCE